jgi:hypothetical protein
MIVPGFMLMFHSIQKGLPPAIDQPVLVSL